MNVFKIAGWLANSVDPDQTQRSAVSDLSLHSFLRTVRATYLLLAPLIGFRDISPSNKLGPYQLGP